MERFKGIKQFVQNFRQTERLKRIERLERYPNFPHQADCPQQKGLDIEVPFGIDYGTLASALLICGDCRVVKPLTSL